MNFKAVLKLSLAAVLASTVLFSTACGSKPSNGGGAATSSNTDSAVSDTSAVSSTDTVSRLNDHQIKMTAYLGNWSEKIDEIKQAQEGKFTFCVQTDTHYCDLGNRNIANNLAALSNFVDFKFVANLGDLVRGYSVEDVDSPDNMRACMDELVKRYTENAACPVFMTVGNHDTNRMWCEKHGDHTFQITPEEQINRVFAPLKDYNGDKMVTDSDGSYYYYDFPEDKVRVIVLNTANGTYDGTGYSKTINIGTAQAEWFKTEALATDYAVMVMTHVPLVPDFPDAGNSVPNSGEILNAVEEFTQKGGRFIAYFYGHTHGQYEYYDENGRLHISFKDGGDFAEAVMIDLKNNTVETIGLGTQNREYRFE